VFELFRDSFVGKLFIIINWFRKSKRVFIATDVVVTVELFMNHFLTFLISSLIPPIKIKSFLELQFIREGDPGAIHESHMQTLDWAYHSFYLKNTFIPIHFRIGISF